MTSGLLFTPRVYEGIAAPTSVVFQYFPPSRPWDLRAQTALRTDGKSGMFRDRARNAGAGTLSTLAPVHVTEPHSMQEDQVQWQHTVQWVHRPRRPGA